MPPAKTTARNTQTDSPATITLADLSEADRKQLLEQAREESKHNPRDVPGYDQLSDDEKVIRELMDARDHARGCPVQEGVELGRVEGYDARKPPNPATGEPARYIGVIRCIECGGSTVLDGTGGRPLKTIADASQAKRAELAAVGEEAIDTTL